MGVRNLILLACICAGAVKAGATPHLARISAKANELAVEIANPGAGQYRIFELRPYESAVDPARAAEWEGSLAKSAIALARFDGSRDRLYSKFLLIDSRGMELGSRRHVTDVSALPARAFAFPTPKSIKGITCPVDLDDVIALGTQHVNDNISFAGFFDYGNPNAPTWEVDGRKIPINARYIAALDQRYRKLTEAGVRITVVLNNHVPATPDAHNPLIHPWTDLKAAPNRLGAINLTNEEGLIHFRAAMEYLAHRYSNPSGEHGWIVNFIVGNEIQQHWEWYNIGQRPAEQVIEDYVRVLRVADLAVRRFHPQMRAFMSMDHHWRQPSFKKSLKHIAGDDLLEGINARVKAEGDFPWGVAFHPYPENLFEPWWWKDSAPLRFDAPKITFKNIEVLPAFLRQERFLFQGEPRSVILSEQGFHAPDGIDGENIQAAAYALAYFKVSHIAGIDAFMLHRHVDHKHEGGLRLGLWSTDPKGPGASTPYKKRRIHEVFQGADTTGWKAVFDFARPLAGLESWEEALPAHDSKIARETPTDHRREKP